MGEADRGGWDPAEAGDGDEGGERDDDGDDQQDPGDDGGHQGGQVQVHPVPVVHEPPDPLLHLGQGGVHLVSHDLNNFIEPQCILGLLLSVCVMSLYY